MKTNDKGVYRGSETPENANNSSRNSNGYKRFFAEMGKGKGTFLFGFLASAGLSVAVAVAATPTTISATSNSGGGIPSGAVMAFYTACPSGWAKYANADGRVIVGAGTGYALGSTGGAAQVTLTVAQMPKHQHMAPFGSKNLYYSATWGVNKKMEMGSYRIDSDDPGPIPYSSFEGESKPFDNRQPYLALNYCYKV